MSINHEKNLSSRRCPHEDRTFAVRVGRFKRKGDGVVVQRYRCKRCKRTFSDATFSPNFAQKKRQHNTAVFWDLVSSVSLRRIALKLNLNRKTVVRKFRLMGRWAGLALNTTNSLFPKAEAIQFDDMESFEHSKLKPLSIPLAITKDRRILGVKVAQIPSKGKLAAKSLAKYGPREDHRKRVRNELFEMIKPLVKDGADIMTDKNPHYKADIAHHFPTSKHRTTKGRRGSVVGQGELKSGGFDPIFSLNHTAAMIRANINRLVRRTWCTTKEPIYLEYHLNLYALFHNLILIPHNLAESAMQQLST